MKFINLLGNTQMLINVQNITFIEQTKDGCKIHFIGGVETITTGEDYGEIRSIIESMSGGDD